MPPILRSLALTALAFLTPQAQTVWHKIYPAGTTVAQPRVIGWDGQNRLFVWDDHSANRGVHYLEGGVWKHEALAAGLESTLFAALSVAPNSTLYALVNLLSPTDAAVYKSTDLGKTWTRIHDKLDGNLNTPPPAVKPSGDLYFYGRPSISTNVNGWLYHSANAGAIWDSLPVGSARVCKQMRVDPAGKLFLTCNSDGNTNFRPWTSVNGATFTELPTASGGEAISCDYSLSADITGVLLVGCTNGMVGMAQNGADTLVLNAIGNGAGGEVTGVAARTSMEFLASANNNGVFRTTNAGGVWSRAGQGMTGTDSALISSMHRSPDGTVYAATSGTLYAYGTVTGIAAPEGRRASGSSFRSEAGGWILTETREGERITLRSTDGRTVQVLPARAKETRISAHGLPRGVMLAEISGGRDDSRFVKLPPR